MNYRISITIGLSIHWNLLDFVGNKNSDLNSTSKIAITGASGHIGANLCRQLHAKGFQMKALIFQDDRAIQGLPIQIIKGDVTDPESLDKLVEDCEVVIHLAAVISIGSKKSDQQLHINTIGTKNIIQACKKAGVKRLIHFSSIHAFDQNPIHEKLDESRKAVSIKGFAYDRSKHSSEKDIIAASKEDLECIILNPTAVLGPFDFKPSLLGQTLMRLKKGSLPALVPGGFDWVDVRDVAEATIAAITNGQNGEKYLLGGSYKSLKDLVDLAALSHSIKKPIINCPYTIALMALPFLNVWSKLNNKPPLYTRMSLDTLKYANRHVSHEKASRELNFNPRPLFETLKDAYDWFDKKPQYAEL
ncbi:MAG: NAD-dependent epimerase/dehydratase family protein [Bacteroidetes bacterium]|nr:NAD-dependent epimerase/dehydratase family protein [Bacteroidota bacterium]